MEFRLIFTPVELGAGTSTPEALNQMVFPAPAAAPPICAPPVLTTTTPLDVLPRFAVPAASVPMKFPWMTVPPEVPDMKTPVPFEEITFWAPAAVPPIVLFGALLMEIPIAVLPRAADPAALTPM